MNSSSLKVSPSSNSTLYCKLALQKHLEENYWHFWMKGVNEKKMGLKEKDV
jgi:hypothetical protein